MPILFNSKTNIRVLHDLIRALNDVRQNSHKILVVPSLLLRSLCLLLIYTVHFDMLEVHFLVEMAAVVSKSFLVEPLDDQEMPGFPWVPPSMALVEWMFEGVPCFELSFFLHSLGSLLTCIFFALLVRYYRPNGRDDEL